MAGLFTSSIGKKVIMSVTGLFLITFLLIHLTINLMTLFGPEAFNKAAIFMETNTVIKIVEPVLALGFIFHIIYSVILYFQNRSARPVRYSKVNQKNASSWESRNMLILGLAVFAFLIVHLINYWYKFKFTDIIESGEMTQYEIVTSIMVPEYWYYIVIYIAGFIFLGLHLNHAFHSAFQTLGINNKYWLPRLKVIGAVYALIITLGFSAIPIYFLIQKII